MKITTLLENTELPSNPGLKYEHGLSIHILHNDKSILFDMGSTDAFAENAKALGVDLSSVDLAIVSHHHYDHGGGLSKFFDLNDKAKVYLKVAEEGKRYSKGKRPQEKYVGLDESLFETHSERFVFINENVEIQPDVFIISQIELTYPKPKGNQYLYLVKDLEWKPDDFLHELILVIKEDDGLVVFTGCAHNGVLNMIDTVNKQFEGYPIKSVIGGFHLIDLPKLDTTADSESEIKEIGKKILSYPIEDVYTGHCTSQKAYGILKNVMEDKLNHLHTGTVIETNCY